MVLLQATTPSKNRDQLQVARTYSYYDEQYIRDTSTNGIIIIIIITTID